MSEDSARASASSLFCDVVGQERALGILRRAVETGPNHAYLFAGPPGVGKIDVAFEFAAALCCGQGGCGECPVCRRVKEGIHPDVEVIAPDGTFITIDQIRELNRDIALKPFEARSRVTIILEAEALRVESANAFLKTLEEPPAHAYFILVTDAPERLLETIVSRCQRVPFARVPSAVLGAYLQERYPVSEVQATAFARVAQGSLAHARELAGSDAARRHREELLEWARRIPQGGLYATHVMVDDILASVESRAEERVARLEEQKARDLEWASGQRERARVEKAYDTRVKRERRRAVADGVAEVLDAFIAWYRDLAWVALGADDGVRNYDYLLELRNEAYPGMVDAYLAAVAVLQRAQERFRYNVDTKSILEDMLLDMKEALLS